MFDVFEDLQEDMRVLYDAQTPLPIIIDCFSSSSYFDVIYAWSALSLKSGLTPGGVIRGAAEYGYDDEARLAVDRILDNRIHRISA